MAVYEEDGETISEAESTECYQVRDDSEAVAAESCAPGLSGNVLAVPRKQEVCKDDLAGQLLDQTLVQAARRKELD